jgi:hypothetical protein
LTDIELTLQRIWLDDVRRPPSEEWTWVKSVDEAIEVLESGTVVEASLDNDLHPFEHDGLEVVEWMIEHRVFPRLVTVHTDNRFASTMMCGLLERSGYRGMPGRPRRFINKDGTGRSTDGIVALSMENSPRAMTKLMEAEDRERLERGKEREEAGPIRLWVDDDIVDRKAPEGWVQATTAWDAIAWLATGNVVALSLDHDLGDDRRFGRGIDVVNWLGEEQEVHDRPLWPEEGITLHTANPYGRDAMARAILRDAGRRFQVAEDRTPSNKPLFRMIPR